MDEQTSIPTAQCSIQFEIKIP